MTLSGEYLGKYIGNKYLGKYLGNKDLGKIFAILIKASDPVLIPSFKFFENLRYKKLNMDLS